MTVQSSFSLDINVSMFTASQMWHNALWKIVPRVKMIQSSHPILST